MLTKVFPVSLVKSRLLTFHPGVPNIFTETLTRLSSYNHYFLMDLDRGSIQEWISFSAQRNGPSLVCWVLENHYTCKHLKYFQGNYFSFLKCNSCFIYYIWATFGHISPFKYLYYDHFSFCYIVKVIMNEIIHKNIFLWSGFCRTFPSSWAINLSLKTTKPKCWPFDKNTIWRHHSPLISYYWVDYSIHIWKKNLLFAFFVLLFLVIFYSFLFSYWRWPVTCHQTALTCFAGM